MNVTISNADATLETFTLRAFGDPCDYNVWEGIDAVEGTYLIDLSSYLAEIELVRFAATNNPLTDSNSNEYCMYARVVLEYLSDPFCEVILRFEIYITIDEACQDIEDVDFSSPTQSLAFTNDNFNPSFDSCTAESGTLNMQTAFDDGTPCSDKFYNFDFSITYG